MVDAVRFRKVLARVISIIWGYGLTGYAGQLILANADLNVFASRIFDAVHFSTHCAAAFATHSRTLLGRNDEALENPYAHAGLERLF